MRYIKAIAEPEALKKEPDLNPIVVWAINTEKYRIKCVFPEEEGEIEGPYIWEHTEVVREDPKAGDPDFVVQEEIAYWEHKQVRRVYEISIAEGIAYSL